MIRTHDILSVYKTLARSCFHVAYHSHHLTLSVKSGKLPPNDQHLTFLSVSEVKHLRYPYATSSGFTQRQAHSLTMFDKVTELQQKESNLRKQKRELKDTIQQLKEEAEEKRRLGDTTHAKAREHVDMIDEMLRTHHSTLPLGTHLYEQCREEFVRLEARHRGQDLLFRFETHFSLAETHELELIDLRDRLISIEKEVARLEKQDARIQAELDLVGERLLSS